MRKKYVIVGNLLVLLAVVAVIIAVGIHEEQMDTLDELLTIQQVDYVRVAYEQPGEQWLQFERLDQKTGEALLGILRDCRYEKREVRSYPGSQEIKLYIILGGENAAGVCSWNDLIFYSRGYLQISTDEGDRNAIVTAEDVEMLYEQLMELEIMI